MTPECMNAQIATAATDAEIRQREWQKGRSAALSNKGYDACPWTSGLTYQWWMDGFNNKNYPSKFEAQ